MTARALTAGPDPLEPAAPSRRVLAVLVLVAIAIGVLAALFRQDGVPKWDTVWAEDGHVFASCAWHLPFSTCLATPYQGYLHFVPRVVAQLAVLFDPRDLGLVMALAEGIAAGLAGALVVRALARSGAHPLLALAGGAGLALVYEAGVEVGGEIANVHLTLFAASAVVLACQLLGRSLDWADLTLIAVTGVTSAFSPALPFVAIGGLVFRTARSGRAFLVATIAAAPQLVVELVSPREDKGVPPALLEMPDRFWRDVLAQGIFGPGYPALGIGLFVLLVVLLAALAVAAVRRWGGGAGDSAAGRRMWSTDHVETNRPLRALLAAGGLTLVAIAAFVASVDINRVVNPRYAYLPSVLLVVALVLALAGVAPVGLGGIDPLSRRGSRSRWSGGSIVQVVVAVALAAAFAATFRVVARGSDGPDVVAQLDAVSSCEPGSDVTVDIAPAGWSMGVPCNRLVSPR